MHLHKPTVDVALKKIVERLTKLEADIKVISAVGHIAMDKPNP